MEEKEKPMEEEPTALPEEPEEAPEEAPDAPEETLSPEEELEAFIARDAEAFLERFPGVDPAALDADESFRRFCGSRYGRESLAELYGDYRALVSRAEQRRSSRQQRSTGSGGGSGADVLSPAERASLEAWNRAYPQMRMTAKEYLTRG